MRTIVQKQFEKGASIPIITFPGDSTAISDSPKLSLVLMDPDIEWTGSGPLRQQIAEWTKQRGTSLFGLVVIAIIVGFFMLMGARVFPSINEYLTIRRAVALWMTNWLRRHRDTET